MTIAASTRDTATVTLPISGMSCASCISSVEDALSSVDGVAAATVNLAAETAAVRFDRAQTDAAALASAVEAAGYAVPTTETRLQIEGLSCASCVASVEGALRGAPGVLEATVNLASERAHVRAIRGMSTRGDLTAAVAAASSGSG